VTPAAGLPPLQDWHDFFAIIGTVSATLIGAMFVVVSLGIGVLTRDRAAAIRTFLSATVGHLSAVLLVAVLTMVPALGWVWLGAGVGIAGIAGLCFGVRIVFGFNQHAGTERSDWYWYAVFPLLGYALLLAAGGLGLRGEGISLDLLAFGLSVLLIAGIRNAWDMIVFLVTTTQRVGIAQSSSSGLEQTSQSVAPKQDK
jgi:hypothetical protein